MPKAPRVLIIGSGDLAQQINHYLIKDPSVQVIGFVDDFVGIHEVKFNQNCLGNIDSISKLYQENIFDMLICGIGYKNLTFRDNLFASLNSIPFYTFIHKSVIIDDSVAVGSDVFICPGTVIEQRTIVGDHVFIYNSVSISHDSFIGPNTFISPSVSIAGFSKVGARCNLGINTTIINNISITDDVQTGGGTVVVKDITRRGLYVGNPARFLK